MANLGTQPLEILKEIEEKHKVVLKEDDPAIALVSLNRMILDRREKQALEAVNQVAEKLDLATRNAVSAINKAIEKLEATKTAQTDIIVNATDYARDELSKAAHDLIASGIQQFREEFESQKKEVAEKTRLVTWSAYLVASTLLILAGYFLAAVFSH